MEHNKILVIVILVLLIFLIIFYNKYIKYNKITKSVDILKLNENFNRQENKYYKDKYIDRQVNRHVIRDRNLIENPHIPQDDFYQFYYPRIERDRSVVNDPLYPPERRYKINVPTRGYPDNYQLIGILKKDEDTKIFQLFGRQTYPGSNLWEYYMISGNDGFPVKIPLSYNKEIYDKDIIYTPLGPFRVSLYNYNTPRYFPFVF